MNKMSSKKWRFNRANHLPHLARLVISSHLRRRADLGTQSSSCIRTSTSALSSPRGGQRTPFCRTAAEATRISLRWAADVLEELEKHGMLIWKKGSRRVPFLASHGLRWGAGPQSNGTKGARGTPLLQNCPQGPQGAGAANVRAGAERHPVGWVPALPAGFLSNVKPRDVQEAHRATLWPIWRPE